MKHYFEKIVHILGSLFYHLPQSITCQFQDSCALGLRAKDASDIKPGLVDLTLRSMVHVRRAEYF